MKRLISFLFIIAFATSSLSAQSTTGLVASSLNTPDLVVSALEVTAITPDKITYKATIKNIGAPQSKVLTGNITIQFYTARVPNGTDRPAGGTNFRLFLAGGTSVVYILSWSRKPVTGEFVGQDILGGFRKYLTAHIDIHNTVAELNENNNKTSVEIRQ